MMFDACGHSWRGNRNTGLRGFSSMGSTQLQKVFPSLDEMSARVMTPRVDMFLNVHKFDGFNDAREVSYIVHDKSVSDKLRLHPCGRLESDVASDGAIKECPYVRGVTLVNIRSCLLTGLAWVG
jgi:hypothetical protein